MHHLFCLASLRLEIEHVLCGLQGRHLVLQPTDPALRVTFDAPGFYGSMGGAFYTPEGIRHLDPDDIKHTGPDFTGIEIQDDTGWITRWLSDVRPHRIFEREGGDYIVFKNSGAVLVVKWNVAAQASEQREL